MQITRQADYAVRAMVYLARLNPGTQVATAQVARDQHIPVTFLAKIMAQLSTAGVVRTTRGAHGGVTLARGAAEITLLEVVETIDGPILLNECALDAGTCEMSDTCSVQVIWSETRTALVQRLGQISLAQLATSGEGVQTPVTLPV